MRTTIDLDEALYAELEREAARRGRPVHELVADGVRRVLDVPTGAAGPATDESAPAPRDPPPWFGVLRAYAANARGAHDLEAMRRSVAAGRPGAA